MADPQVSLSQFIIAVLKVKGLGMASAKKLFDGYQIDSKLNFKWLQNSTVPSVKKALSKKYLTEEIFQKYLDEAFFELQFCTDHQIIVLNFFDERYPQNLKQLKKYPPILYVRGNVDLLNDDKMVAMIGTRHPSKFAEKVGLRIAKYFAGDLGYTIVSGLAIGVDTVAHLGAMQTTQKTIAVLGYGLDQTIYPRRNQKLAEDIVSHGGLLVTTYPIGTTMIPQFLAARDEWQCGLSDGVIALETGLKGGTNNAMNHALKQKKPLAAIDHRQFFPEEVVNDLSHALGNFQYIDQKEATPLFSKQSLDQFDQEMSKWRASRDKTEAGQTMNLFSDDD